MKYNNTNLKEAKAILKAFRKNAQIEIAKDIYSQAELTTIWYSNHQILITLEDVEHSNGLDIMLIFENNERDQEGLVQLLSAESKKQKIELPYLLAAYIHFVENYRSMPSQEVNGKIYLKEGMIKRVIQERRKRARELEYRVRLNKNLYDDHTLIGKDGVILKVAIWDLEAKTGYVDNIDWKTNKLATTKHIIFLCNYLGEVKSRLKRLRSIKSKVELTLDPLHNYDFTWKYNSKINKRQFNKIEKIFGPGVKHVPISALTSKITELHKLSSDPKFIIRPEVFDRLSKHYDELFLKKKKIPLDKLNFKDINTELYSYQKSGVAFALFKSGAIIADEMGLGKTLQAIATAILKKKYFKFSKTLIICPASVKYQWQLEIEKFSNEQATVVAGNFQQRQEIYLNNKTFFTIANYESVVRDIHNINETKYDFIILDEAQKIKNYNTKAASVIQRLHKNHGLILTGTPIENKLIDIYSLILFLDKYRLTPLWEFSYQHCVFDMKFKNKINGYYNLNQLQVNLSDLIIRRQKKEVLKQLPNITEKNIMLRLHPAQNDYHASYKKGIASLLAKKFKTSFDWDRIMMLLTKMRRVSNSTYLIDNDTNFSSKLIELEHILSDQLELSSTHRKIIIFSEWLDSLKLIEEILKKLEVTYVKLTGSIPAAKRGKLIDTFRDNNACKIFLSTEAGGTGLNLQMADTVINFEIPWNPAKKNQRIGRIDRIGQRHKNLHVINLICEDSIEMRIASGLMLKQNLFDGVLNRDNPTDAVDFSEQGRAQFLKMLEELINEPQHVLESPGVQLTNTDDLQKIEEPIDITAYSSNEVDAPPPAASIEPAQEPDAVAEAIPVSEKVKEYEKLEAVLNKGMDFLAGIYQMSTGKEMTEEDSGKRIEIDQETGEVVMRFKFKF